MQEGNYPVCTACERPCRLSLRRARRRHGELVGYKRTGRSLCCNARYRIVIGARA